MSRTKDKEGRPLYFRCSICKTKNQTQEEIYEPYVCGECFGRTKKARGEE